MPDLTPYSTVTGFSNAPPAWVPWIIDAERLKSYAVYEAMYWNVPETFKLVARGSEDKPIYLPSARKIINTIDRYVGNNFTWVGSSPEIQQFFDDLFTREAFMSQFQGNKLYGIIRGDWLWHVLADPSKPVGKRLTIKALDPGQYFPIYDENDVDRVIGCHIVEQIANPEDPDKTAIKRLTYRREVTDSGVPYVTSEIAIFETDEWGDPEKRPIQMVQPLTILPGQITALPVYHIKNFYEPQNPFGSSELRGMERIIAAINQSISDEDLTLAMDGLGLYFTNMRSVDPETGDELEWDIGPAKVLEGPTGAEKNASFFERVQGVGSITPYLDHIKFLIDEMMEGMGIPGIASGKVDVQVAESGVALLLELAPILSSAEKKDQLLLDTHNQMFYDLLNGWVPAYEGTSFGEGATLTAHVGEKLPFNRKQRFEELLQMLVAKVIDTEYFRTEMSKLGYQFPSGMAARVEAEQTSLADPITGRVMGELNNTGEE